MKNIITLILETLCNLGKLNTKRIRCQTAENQGQRGNLESNKAKMICNNMINNWFIGNNGDQMAVCSDILKVMIWNNTINEELNIFHCACVCICVYVSLCVCVYYV